MDNKYTPFLFPASLGAMSRNYQNKITSFDGIGTYIAQQHTRKMIDYFKMYEIDTANVQMRIFVQILTRDVRTWFRALAPQSIDSLRTL